MDNHDKKILIFQEMSGTVIKFEHGDYSSKILCIDVNMPRSVTRRYAYRCYIVKFIEDIFQIGHIASSHKIKIRSDNFKENDDQ